MELGLVGQAVGMFAVTNVDDIVVLALFFSRATGRGDIVRVVIGQYAGFGVLLAASVVGALGAVLLPAALIPYLGLLPLLLGLRAAWSAWRERASTGDGTPRVDGAAVPGRGPSVAAVAAVTIANGGDNLGVYVPVFAAAGAAALVVFVVVFLALVGLWCAVGRFVATRPPIARALTRWGHVLLPVVLVAIGLLILVEGGAFGL